MLELQSRWAAAPSSFPSYTQARGGNATLPSVSCEKILVSARAPVFVHCQWCPFKFPLLHSRRKCKWASWPLEFVFLSNTLMQPLALECIALSWSQGLPWLTSLCQSARNRLHLVQDQSNVFASDYTLMLEIPLCSSKVALSLQEVSPAQAEYLRFAVCQCWTCGSFVPCPCLLSL